MKKNWICIAIACLCYSISYAQMSDPFGSIESISAEIVDDHKYNELARHHKKLPLIYSGYFIELTQSEDPLPRNHSTLRQHGIVYYHEINRLEVYSYGLTTTFNSRKEAKRYVQTVVKPKSEEGKLFLYRRGKRKEIKIR